VQGQLEFAAASKAERSAGVWIDGQYVGYVDELKDENKVMLLPGTHEISLRLAGYQDQTLKVVVEPRKSLVVKVRLERDSRVHYSEVTAEVKLQISPDRAAVFVDDAFAGHAGEFGGIGRGMLIAPGKHRIRIALAGYQTFETEINLSANQKTEIKTDLVKASVTPK
jgi:23S rRNA A2030 N6-methylase RlmJ